MESYLLQATKAHQAGDLNKAIELYRAVLADNPHSADAIHMMGVIAQQRGNPSLALQLIDAAIKENIQGGLVWHNRALVLKAMERSKEALTSALKAVSCDKSLSDAWDFLGILARESGKLEDAEIAHRTAITLSPSTAAYHANLAQDLLEMGKIEAAYESAKHAAGMDATLPPLALAQCLKAAGYPAKAIPYFEKCCALLPDHPALKTNMATAYLQIGDYKNGLPLFEFRRDGSDGYNHIPYWDGGHVDHLLLYEDQGLGDAIFAIRFYEQAKKYAGKITIVAPPALLSLFKENGIHAIDKSSPLSDGITARARLMSLPHLLKTGTESDIPNAPYLKAPKDKLHYFQDMLQRVRGPKIGLVWSGNAKNPLDKIRSISFDACKTLINLSPQNFVGLQVGDQAGSAALSAMGGLDVSTSITDLADTAAVLAHIDLLITVDTAPMHLAAAMGRPVWMLNYFNCDWRWQLNREDCPWYSTLKQYRQTKPHHWDDVIKRIERDAEKYLGGDLDILKPAPHSGPAATENSFALQLD